MKITKIPIPIYGGFLRIVIADNFNEAANKLKIDNEGFDLENFGAFVNVSGFGNGLDFFTVIFKPNPDPALIAHEVVHLVNGIFIERHIDLDKNNDEPQAYLTGWVTEHIYKSIKT